MDNGFVNSLLQQSHLPAPVRCMPWDNKDSIAKTICAFLNAQGGWIVIGLDEEHRYVGLREPYIQDTIQRELVSNIIPLPLVYVQPEQYEGKEVVLITVIKGALPPYSYKGKYYVQQGDKVVSPSFDGISMLIRDSYPLRSRWEIQSNVFASRSDLDEQYVQEVYRKGLESGRLHEGPDGKWSFLSELQLANVSEVKNGAIALFAKNVNRLLPQCRVRIQLMAKGKSSDRFDDCLVVEGNIFVALEQTLHYFQTRLPRVSFFVEGKYERQDELLYPIDVLDEAISNALIHRDYSDRLDEITIFIYNDKIEITNSGLLPEKIVSGKTKVLPHGSVLRNPLMAEVFYIAGQMEKTGRGMALISNRMSALGRRSPEWICTNGKTTLRLFSQKEHINLNKRILAFINGHRQGSYFTKADYIKFFDKQPSKVTAQNDLSLMLRMGLCERIGQGPSTKYKLV